MLACMRLTVKFSVTAPTSSRRVIPASIIDLHQSANYCSNDTEHCLITDNSDTDMFTSLLGLLLRDSMSLNRTNRRMCIDGKKSYQCICPDKVKGLRPPGRPRSCFNDVALRDCQNCRISRPYRDAQDRLLWRDKTCPART